MYKNDNSAYLRFLIMSPDPYFTSFSFLDHNSGTFRSILMLLGRIIEQVNMECHMQVRQLCLSSFSNYFTRSIFLLHFMFMEGNSTTFHNILIFLGSIIEQVNMECHMQE